ncbi:MAG TPA: SpoIID/LytB domain-containing protein [Lachnospiraceae bacterium]|nr:SpoIID/LytB domain-containing protein [Lachnospiraceae bacterium]
MKKNIASFILLLFFIVAIPCILTILLSGKSQKVPLKGSTARNITIAVKDEENTTNVPMDTYIMMALCANMPVTYEDEALKAQSVIIRTYIYMVADTKATSNLNAEDLGLDYRVLATMKEVWGEDSYTANLTKLEDIINDTNGEVITYKEKLILPLFHEVSTGKTRSAEAATGEKIEYLVSVDCSFDVNSSEYMKINSEEKADVIQTILNSYPDAVLDEEELFEQIVVTERDSFGYVKRIQVGGITITGDEFARCLNLNSPNFYIESYEKKVRFICKGKGHGVGLSQYGANYMATQGSKYKEILLYFYPGCEIGR